MKEVNNYRIKKASQGRKKESRLGRKGEVRVSRRAAFSGLYFCSGAKTSISVINWDG